MFIGVHPWLYACAANFFSSGPEKFWQSGGFHRYCTGWVDFVAYVRDQPVFPRPRLDRKKVSNSLEHNRAVLLRERRCVRVRGGFGRQP
jgi:hypothetical protein